MNEFSLNVRGVLFIFAIVAKLSRHYSSRLSCPRIWGDSGRKKHDTAANKCMIKPMIARYTQFLLITQKYTVEKIKIDALMTPQQVPTST